MKELHPLFERHTAVFQSKSKSKSNGYESSLVLGGVGDGPEGTLGIIRTTTHNTEEAMFTPVRTPRVTTDPVVDAVLGAPTVQLDRMVDHDGVAVVVLGNSTRIRLQTVGIDVGRDGATSIDLRHDILFAIHGTELADCDFRIVRDSVARLVWLAIHASVHISALHILGLVLLAGDFGNTILVHPCIGSGTISSVAASSMTAVDEHLNRRDHITHCTIGSNLDTISN